MCVACALVQILCVTCLGSAFLNFVVRINAERARFKRLLSISGGYCPIILHRIKQRHIVRARFLSHVKRARARRGHCPIHCTPLRTRATDRMKRAASCCHNCGMTFLQ